jgi:tRNA (guanine37-N1)-methyltransferase
MRHTTVARSRLIPGTEPMPMRRGGRYSVVVRISIITIFPEFFTSPLQVSFVGRAQERGALSVDLIDLRSFGHGVHRQVDDAPFGGGAGMVMMVEPLANALGPLEWTHRVLLTPAGEPLDQAKLDAWAQLDAITIVCGRYEGVDERVAQHLIDEEVSLGDFVLMGGEVAALAIVEGLTRLIPDVVGNPASIATESFRDRGLLEEPQYTRPAEFRGWPVPEVLLSGDHGRIEEWRRAQRETRTRQRRPDLLGHGDSAEGSGDAGT